MRISTATGAMLFKIDSQSEFSYIFLSKKQKMIRTAKDRKKTWRFDQKDLDGGGVFN
jgi:hypothetical protein